MANNQTDQSAPAARTEQKALPEQLWSMTQQAVLDHLDVSTDWGLTSDVAEQRLDEYGPNRLRQIKRRSSWDILREQFKSLIVLILMVAALASFARQAWIDGGAIAVPLVVNTIIGFLTELRATRSIESLQEMDEVEATVRRNGQKQRLAAEQLVPGDLVIFNSGEMVAADIRVLAASKLQADEAALTGESLPVEKQAEPVETAAPLAERASMLYKGTAITRGQGEGVVVASGMQTELGGISAMVESAKDEQTPLEQRLDQLGQKLVWITLGVAAAIGGAGWLAGRDLELMIATAIALAIAAVPEGLPIVATIALARGMWRMLRRNALIRRLSSVETLGATNVICTDKTGTLTAGQMTVQRLALISQPVEVNLTANGTETFQHNGQSFKPQKNLGLKRALQVAVLCNDAERKPVEGDGKEKVETNGDPMEVALLAVGSRAGQTPDHLLKHMPEVKRQAFDRETKKMGTVHEAGDGYLVAVKGAPEAVLESCTHLYSDNGQTPLDEQKRQQWLERNQHMAEEGLRVLGLATRIIDSPEADIYENLQFLGLVGLMDPPRPGVAQAIERYRSAGIRVIMVTGDQPETARAIAESIKLVDNKESEVIHGADLGDLNHSLQQRPEQLLGASIFARVSPKQKLNLIDLHQDHGAIVAMTGDGVNDAPALKTADIGIAMGQRGTQVAREAADMILQDDAFPTIVAAVEQGRIIFDNIRKFVIYLLSGNVGEILAVALAAITAAPLPLLPIQILYLNVLNDAFPALALSVGDSHQQVMDRQQRNSKEPIVAPYHWGEIAGYGLLIGVTILGVFYLAFAWLGLDRTGAVTISFLSLSLARLLHVFNMRTADSGLIDNEIVCNPYVWEALALSSSLLLLAVYWPLLATILKVTPPSLNGWVLVLLGAVAPLIIGQIYLALFKSKQA
jgi:Ca2+-transporting ATPase